MRIAIVDDNPEDSGFIHSYLQRYQEERGTLLDINLFQASYDFLENFRSQYDVIFLDIEMPGTNGLEVAREIRTKDQQVGIIFVTSLAQYAIAGYEVNAMDYMVKPIRYFNFCVKLDKALQSFRQRESKSILIKGRDGIIKLEVDKLMYLEKDRDDILFHTTEEILRERGSIKDIKAKLADTDIEECISGCLVNLHYIKRLSKDSLLLTDHTELPLSRRNRKTFTDRYINFMGGL